MGWADRLSPEAKAANRLADLRRQLQHLTLLQIQHLIRSAPDQHRDQVRQRLRLVAAPFFEAAPLAVREPVAEPADTTPEPVVTP